MYIYRQHYKGAAVSLLRRPVKARVGAELCVAGVLDADYTGIKGKWIAELKGTATLPSLLEMLAVTVMLCEKYGQSHADDAAWLCL